MAASTGHCSMCVHMLCPPLCRHSLGKAAVEVKYHTCIRGRGGEGEGRGGEGRGGEGGGEGEHLASKHCTSVVRSSSHHHC